MIGLILIRVEARSMLSNLLIEALILWIQKLSENLNFKAKESHKMYLFNMPLHKPLLITTKKYPILLTLDPDQN